MSSSRSTSDSEGSAGSDSEPPRRRPSIHSSTLPRRTFSSNIRRREGPLPRIISDGFEELDQLTSRRLSRLPGQGREHTVSEFLREDSRPSPSDGPDVAAELRRQTIMAMDRKRRLTSSGYDGGRRRTTQGGYHERGSSGQSLRFDGPSSPRRTEGLEPRASQDLPAQVIDLTGSSPTARPAILPPISHPNFLPVPPQPARPHATSRGSSSSSRRYNVPRWQPDSEAAECAVCGRGFSFMFRRHHCRKCGRVVCNDCSPHRITIPRSLIVNPPGLDSSSSSSRPIMIPSGRVETVDLTGDDDNTSQNRSAHYGRPELEGGEKVRLCNPCVPDPQPEPQEEHNLPKPLSRSRPQKGVESSSTSFPDRLSTLLNARTTSIDAQRYVTDVEDFRRPSGSTHTREGQILGSPSRYAPVLPEGSENGTRRPAMQSSYGFSNPSLPTNPHNVFPPRYDSTNALSSSFESRFGHIRRLISNGMGSPSPLMQPHRAAPLHPNHSRYQSLDSGGRSAEAGNRPRMRSMLDVEPNLQPIIDSTMGQTSHGQALHRPQYRESDICPICRRLLPPCGADGDETDREAHIVECINARDPATAQSASIRQQLMGQPPPSVPVQMISFAATEKDCLAEDGNAQECSICMVEYDVGDQLARLECLCKFHKACIESWFARKQECPLHKVG